MPSIELQLDGPWPNLADQVERGEIIACDEEALLGVAALPGEMASGRCGVALRLALPDGKQALIRTSLRALWNAVNAIAARHGDPFMNPHLQTTDTQVLGLRAALAVVTEQLIACQVRHGESPVVRAGDG